MLVLGSSKLRANHVELRSRGHVSLVLSNGEILDHDNFVSALADGRVVYVLSVSAELVDWFNCAFLSVRVSGGDLEVEISSWVITLSRDCHVVKRGISCEESDRSLGDCT